MPCKLDRGKLICSRINSGKLGYNTAKEGKGTFGYSLNEDASSENKHILVAKYILFVNKYPL
jgi:hypothetical protein